MIDYLIPAPNNDHELPEQIKGAISVIAHDTWHLRGSLTADELGEMPNSIVGEVTVLTQHEERFDNVDVIRTLAQALGVAIHDLHGCTNDKAVVDKLLDQVSEYIHQGVSIGHSFDKKGQ